MAIYKVTKFRLKNLVLALEDFTKRQDNLAYVGRIVPVHQYTNGQKTDEIIGYSYWILISEEEHIFLPVKVLGDPIFTQQDIEKTGLIPVVIDGFEVKFYTNSKNYPELSASATEIKIYKEA